MLLSNINLNLLFIFTKIYKSGSITAASKELNLTQPGVSQHLQGLEYSLDLKLFDRINRKLVPTPAAKKLYQDSIAIFNQFEESLIKIKEGNIKLMGTISIGVPYNFGNNVVLPQISSFCQKHPGVKFNITYGLSNLMNELLLKGEIDFAFVDSFGPDKSIKVETVFKEKLSLYVSKSYRKKHQKILTSVSDYEQLDYISYLEGGPILRNWFEHHYKRRNINLNIRARAMDVHGVSKLIVSDLGAGILPEHHVLKLGKDRNTLVKIEGKKSPMINLVSVAYLEGRSLSPIVKVARDEIIKGLSSKKRSSL